MALLKLRKATLTKTTDHRPPTTDHRPPNNQQPTTNNQQLFPQINYRS